MPKVTNSEDAKVELDAIQKERYLLKRLRDLLLQERDRLLRESNLSTLSITYMDTVTNEL